MARFIVTKKYKIIVIRNGFADLELLVTPSELRELRLQIIKAERQQR